MAEHEMKEAEIATARAAVKGAVDVMRESDVRLWVASMALAEGICQLVGGSDLTHDQRKDFLRLLFDDVEGVVLRSPVQ